jgi:Domain of unknown function (DUF4349)
MNEQGGNAATIERELAAIDAALTTGVAGDDDPAARELQELALALRADSAAPEPAFAQRLGERVAAGFPPEPGSARARASAIGSSLRRAPRRAVLVGRRVLPAAGIVGAIVLPIVLAVTLAGPPNGDDADGGGGGSVAAPESGAGGGGGGAGDEARLEAQPDQGAGSGVSPSAPVPVPRDGGFAPGQSNRRIERSISLDLEVPLDEMARVAEDVTAVTNRHGGFVLSSSVDTGEDSGGGDFSLRIPADRLRPALRDLAGLAPVIRQTQEGRDVTRQHVTAKDRLQAARAERRSLLRRLAVAATDEEAEAIRRRLDLVAGEINGLRAQLRDLRLRTDYAVVLVSMLVPDGTSDGGGAGMGGSFDDAIGDAGDLLVGAAGVLIRLLALALPIGVIGVVGWLAARGLRRRRRESVLA